MKKDIKHKKLVTSENDIVRDILSFKGFGNREAEDVLVAKITIFALDNLADEYKLNKKLRVNYDPRCDRRCGSFGYKYKNINVSSHILESRKGYGHDIVVILHEVMHYAQTGGSKFSDKKQMSNKSSYEVNELAGFVTAYLFGFGEFKNKNTFAKDKNLVNIYKKVREYSRSKYYLEPTEVQARMFSYDMLEKIIDIAKEENGFKTINEWANLREFEKTLSKLKDTEYKWTKLAKSYVERYEDFFDEIFRDSRRILFERDEIGENAFDRLNNTGKDYNHYILNYNNIVKQTLMSLVYDYDEEYASKLFDEVVKFDQPLFDAFSSNLMDLVVDTNYSPTEEQKERYLGRLDEKDREVYETSFAIAESFVVDKN